MFAVDFLLPAWFEAVSPNFDQISLIQIREIFFADLVLFALIEAIHYEPMPAEFVHLKLLGYVQLQL